MKKLLLLASILSVGLSCLATDLDEEQPKVKKANHYIGLQANFLLRELVNIGGNNTELQNPFGFVYHINSRRTGWGVRFGLGPQIYNSTNRDGSAIITSNGYDISARIGIDKRIKLDNKWDAGLGLDAIIIANNDKTINDQLDFLGQKNEITSNNMAYGGGFMGYLQYYLRPKILLGTEASFYYLTGTSKNKIVFTDQNGNEFSESDDKDKFSNGQLILPISVYLFIKI